MILINFVTKQLMIEHWLYDWSVNNKDIKFGERIQFDTLI